MGSSLIPPASNVTTLTGPSVINTVLLVGQGPAGTTDHLALTNIGTNTHAQIDTALTRLASTSGTNTGDQTSVTGNAGTATALQTARTIDGQSFDGTANITVIAPGTFAAASKATPVDADQIPLVDSAASNGLKKLTWANLKATLKTYLDTLYQAILVSGTNIKTINSTSLLGSGDIALVTSPGGSTTQVQFNNAGAFGGNAGFTYNSGTNTLSVANLTLGASPTITNTSGDLTLTSFSGVLRVPNASQMVNASGNAGFYYGAGDFRFYTNNTSSNYRFQDATAGFLGGGALKLGATTALAWGAAADVGSNTLNAALLCDGSGILAQRNGGNAQAFNLFDTYTDASNGSWLAMRWVGSVAYLVTDANGTGGVRQLTIGTYTGGGSLNLMTAGGSRWQVSSTGHFLALADNGYDIGASAASRPRTIYVGSHAIVNGLRSTPSAAPTIASAATIAPTTQFVFISGTAAIATITAPSPISAGGGQITLIPTGIFTTTTAGNIALASTAVVSKALTMTYDTTTAKWYPSY